MPLPCNKEHMQLWVNALRSGDYLQGRCYLNSGGRFCCLGVANEVAIENGVAIEKRQADLGHWVYDEFSGTLSPAAFQWLGLSGTNTGDVIMVENFAEGFGDLYAIRANDILVWTFEQIADALTATYLTPEQETTDDRQS